MGFSSLNCEVCGHPLLCEAATERGRLPWWLTQVVIIQPDGAVTRGQYDGYGAVEIRQGAGPEWYTDPSLSVRLFDDEGNPSASAYHELCHTEADGPTEYSGPSTRADCQGWFMTEEQMIAMRRTIQPKGWRTVTS